MSFIRKTAAFAYFCFNASPSGHHEAHARTINPTQPEKSSDARVWWQKVARGRQPNHCAQIISVSLAIRLRKATTLYTLIMRKLREPCQYNHLLPTRIGKLVPGSVSR